MNVILGNVPNVAASANNPPVFDTGRKLVKSKKAPRQMSGLLPAYFFKKWLTKK